MSRPWIDLLVGCGGWSAPLLLASYFLVDAAAQQWAAVFYGLALVCNYPHYMATVHRAYWRREDRARYRVFTHYVTALLFVVALAAHARPDLLVWLFTLYVMWSPWHYSGQNFGLCMMFLRRARIDVSSRERRGLYVAFVASYVMLLAAFNEGVSRDPLVASAGLPGPISWTIQVAAGAIFLVSGLLALGSMARRAGRRQMIAPVTLYSTQAFWFVAPLALTWITGTPAPQTRYSTGMLAVMHSAQYLWITKYYARRDTARPGETGRAWSGWQYWGTLIAGGVALFLPGPWLASYVGHYDFTYSMLTVTAVINIHHFILDGVVWKLRDPRVAQALVSREAHGIGAAALASAVTRRYGGRMAGAMARAAAVILLAALALVDQWRYLLTLRQTDQDALKKASALNPYDSSVRVRLATAVGQSGDLLAAERALDRAIDVNPHDPVPYRRLERLLIESGRLPEAYAHVERLLTQWPDDVDALVNAGVLAQRLGDAAAAERWWRRALDREPSLLLVHLYLAEMLDATRAGEAALHYQRYLDLVVRQPDATRPDARQVALVVVKFADALARTGEKKLATTQYDLAARIARGARLNEVEALARQRLADLR